MNDEPQDKNTGGERRPLTLRKTETGQVKQTFPHGRTKTVVVQKKRRVIGPDDGKPATATAPSRETVAEKPAAPRTPASARPAPPAPKAQPKVLHKLSDTEQRKRAQALAVAKKQQEERSKRDAEERVERDKREADERARLDAMRKAEVVEEERRQQEAEVRQKAEEETRKPQARESADRKKRPEPKARPVVVTPDVIQAAEATPRKKGLEKEKVRDVDDEEPEVDAENPLSALGGRIKQKRSFAAPADAKAKEAPKRRTGRLTIAKALEDDDRQRSLASVRRAREKEKASRAQRQQDTGRQMREVTIPDTITVQELAQRMAMRATDLVRELMKQGQMVQPSEVLDADDAQLIAEDLGHTVKRVSESDVEDGLLQAGSDSETLEPRPPVVTIMGHVDHGKTSLLDALRQTNVVSGEAGGITQHIGAYQVTAPDGGKITFLDTPGHAAFTQMRARGANVTDIVIIVVAADDGVMPQTVESINHAKAAGVPIIVAINKIDKSGVDPNRVKTGLLQHEIQVESMGGEVQEVEVSALKRLNLDGLLEAIQLQAELLELKGDPKRQPFGTVVEARLDKGRGTVATMLVQGGTLKRGDIVVAGAEWGKVRAITDDQGKTVQQALPAQPVEILGLNGVPDPGEQFVVVESEARAREITDYRQRKRRDKVVAANSGTSLEMMMAQLQDAEIKDLPLVLKGDVQGSVEAIIGALGKMANREVRVRVLHSGVGAISESDVVLANASKAPVLGFNVRANTQARLEAERTGTEIRYYSVIYDLLDDIKGTLTGMLAPELRETFLGNAAILEVFNIAKKGRVAGCRVTEGSVKRGAKVRLLRDNVVIHEGELSQLRRFKDDVNEVPAGQECGMSFANYEDLKAGDVIECFNVERIQRTLESVA